MGATCPATATVERPEHDRRGLVLEHDHQVGAGEEGANELNLSLAPLRTEWHLRAAVDPPTPDPRMPLISARELTKRYPGVNALDGLTLDIEPGIIGFVGANGAGKSTFIRILLGPPRADERHGVGARVRRPGRRASSVRKLVGYMPEHDCLPLEISGTDFVTHMGQMSGLPFTAARERAAEMLRHVGLHEERYRLIGSYSTGMKQRIKLAQSLVHDPKLLLLDEPTNGLDPEGREEMLMLVERTGREFGIAVMVTSHLLGEIERVCDSLIAIDAGTPAVRRHRRRRSRSGRSVCVSRWTTTCPAFAAQLRARGLDVEAHGASELRVDLGDESVYDIVRDVAADLSVPLARMEVTRHRLEELFRDAGRWRCPWLNRAPPARSTTSAISGTPARGSAALYAIRTCSLSRFARRSALGAATRRRRCRRSSSASVYLPALVQVGDRVGGRAQRRSSTIATFFSSRRFSSRCSPRRRRPS